MNVKELFQQYPYSASLEEVEAEVKSIIDQHAAKNRNTEVYKTCFSCIDLTSLNVSDTTEQISSMVRKVNDFGGNFPEIPNVGGICVYPSLVQVVRDTLQEEVEIASVAAGFPASQTFIEVKIAETSMAVMEGATEIDIVISLGKFLEGSYEEVAEEIQELKDACRNAHLKVILETGSIIDPVLIYKASILAMAAGADFIKTSTGKTPVAATPEATFVMCTAIRDWNLKTGEQKGYKPAGGIVTTEEAVIHYTLVESILGPDWLQNKLFRIGASRLANNLLSSIEGQETKYF